MRLPLAPSKSPATDSVGSGSAFSIVAMTRAHSTRTKSLHQKVANDLAVDTKWGEPSLLVEGLVAGFAQRCDRLMEDLEAVQDAPTLFNPMWPIVVLSAGTRNEEWMMFWSQMRRAER